MKELNRKVLGIALTTLFLAMLATPFALVAATKSETITLEGTYTMYPFTDAHGPCVLGPPGPFAYAQPAGKSGHMSPAGFDGTPTIWDGDIALGSNVPGVGMHMSSCMMDTDGDGEPDTLMPYPVADEPYGTYSAIWLMKNYLNPEKDNEYVITGFFYLEDAEVDGVGEGDLIIKTTKDKLVIVDGTEDLKGLRGIGETTSYVGPGLKYAYSIEAHMN